MHAARPLLSAAGALAGSTLLGALTGAGFWMVAAHTFGDHQVGLASTAVAALTLVALLSAQPLNVTTLTRLPALLASDRQVAAGFIAAATGVSVTLAAALGTVAALVLPHLLDEPSMGAWWVTLAVIIAAITQAAGVVLDAAAVAARAGKISVTRNGLHGAVKLATLAALSLAAGALSDWFHLPVPAAGAAIATWALGGVVSLSYAVRKLRTHIATTPTRADIVAGAKHLGAGAGAQLIGVLSASTPSQVIPLVVAAVAGAAGAAAFSMSWMVAGMLFMVSTSLCSAALTTAGTTSTRARWRLLGWGHVVVLTCGIGGAFIGGQWALSLAGMENTVTGAAVLKVLALAAVPNALANMAVSALRIRERLRAVALATAAGAALTLTLVAPLTTSLGPAGGGWAWAAGQSLTAVIAGLALLRRTRRSDTADVTAHAAAPVELVTH